MERLIAKNHFQVEGKCRSIASRFECGSHLAIHDKVAAVGSTSCWEESKLPWCRPNHRSARFHFTAHPTSRSIQKALVGRGRFAIYQGPFFRFNPTPVASVLQVMQRLRLFEIPCANDFQFLWIDMLLKRLADLLDRQILNLLFLPSNSLKRPIEI